MNRWFLPSSPDLLGLLAHQGEVTIGGMDAFTAWSKAILLRARSFATLSNKRMQPAARY